MPIGATVQRLDAVESTNDAARALALGGAAHGTAVVAAEQTRGRGTKGRTWHSPAGLGLYASFILRGPAGAVVPAPHLIPLAAGLAAADALLEACGLEARLKWPNDVLVAGKKLGGVLSEGVSGGPGGSFVVVGIGLNAGHGPEDFPAEVRALATSVRLEGGGGATPGALWDPLCRSLERWYNVLARGDKEAVVSAFEARSAFAPGDMLRIETAAGGFEAAYRGLDPEGRLLVDRTGRGTVALDAVLKLDRRP